MKDSEKALPLEKKVFEIEIDGASKKIPALDKRWVEMKKRSFSRYYSHPVAVDGKFVLGEKETWLELTEFVISDLEWLLQQRHHIFWSHMIFSKSAQQLLITFLQEAPPFYLRGDFPKDEEMTKTLEKVEHLVFLVFVRLSTEKESDSCYIEKLGQLLYDNYIFTVPILLDMCLIYGIKNKNLVEKMLDDVITAAPQYLTDFKEVVPHFLNVLGIVKSKFENSKLSVMKDKSEARTREIRDLILHLYDSAANIRVFLDVYSNGSKLFRIDGFANEVAYFYSNVIPKIYGFVKKNNCDTLRTWNFPEKIDYIRLHLLSIVRNVYCGIVNDVLNDQDKKEEYAHEFMTKIMEILQEPLFLSDYNRLFSVDADMILLKEMCTDLDTENLRYISEAIAPFNEVDARAEKPTTVTGRIGGVELESLITEVKDIFPHLGDGFVEACLQHYNYNTENVIAAILEDKLPPDIGSLSWDLTRKDLDLVQAMKPPRDQPIQEPRVKMKDFETAELLNDKTEIREMRDRFERLALVPDDYNDEYDDTYDEPDVFVREADDADQERRPFVTPRVLRGKEEREESEEEDEEEGEEAAGKVNDHFVPNPAEIRAKQEQKRMEKAKRDYVGRGKGHGQEKQVLANRDFKNTHKSFMGNHNRRKLASRKRNIPLVNS